MSTSELVKAYEPEARTIPGLPASIIYLSDNPDVVTGLRAFMENGIGYIEGAPNYTVTRRIALHEFGHLRHFNHRDEQELFWMSRFGGCISAPVSWAQAKADSENPYKWAVDPGESIAECFAVAVEGVGRERTLDYGCTIDPAKMKEFFMGTLIEWVGPAAGGNYMSGRSGKPITTIVDHWTTGSLTSAVAHFKTPGTQVSAHYIVGFDGRIVQVVQDADTAFHAGVFTVNQVAIGIEHECGPVLAPTDALYAASAQLHEMLSEKYAIDLEVGVTVKRHNNIVITECPGTLDLDRIVKEAEDLAFTEADRAMLKRIEDKLNPFTKNVPEIWLRRLFWGFDPQTRQKRDPGTPVPPDLP